MKKNEIGLVLVLVLGLVMGGCFIGRPMDPESRPAKTKKAKAKSLSQVTLARLETSRPRPVWRRDSPEMSPSATRSSNKEGQGLE